MPSPATVRERRLRKTKAQLIDEIDVLEQRAAAIEAAYGSGAPLRAKAGKDDPEQAVEHLEPRPSPFPLQNCHLLAEGEVFQV